MGVKNSPTIFSKPKRILSPENFKLSSSTHTIVTGDKVDFKAGSCATGATLATIIRSASNTWDPDPVLTPLDLLDGKYYSMCYITTAQNYKFDLGQIYIAKTSTKVDPSDISAFMIVGVEFQLDISGGDEAYGDIIRFSESCNSPKTTDYFVQRKTNNIYSKIITKDFQVSRRYKMCFIPSYANGVSFYMDSINDHEWVAAATPQLSTSNTATFNINDKPMNFVFETPFSEGDKLAFAWKDTADLD